MSRHRHGTMEGLSNEVLLKLSQEFDINNGRWKEVSLLYLLGYVRGVICVAHLMEWKEVAEAWQVQEAAVKERMK